MLHRYNIVKLHLLFFFFLNLNQLISVSVRFFFFCHTHPHYPSKSIDLLALFFFSRFSFRPRQRSDDAATCKRDAGAQSGTCDEP